MFLCQDLIDTVVLSLPPSQVLDLFSLELDTSKKPAKTQEAAGGIKSVLENLPDLWDEDEYKEQYNIETYVSSMGREGQEKKDVWPWFKWLYFTVTNERLRVEKAFNFLSVSYKFAIQSGSSTLDALTSGSRALQVGLLILLGLKLLSATFK